MSGNDIAWQTGCSKSGVTTTSYVLSRGARIYNIHFQQGITNYGIVMKVYSLVPRSGGRSCRINIYYDGISIVVLVAILPYSQCIYVEGMIATKELQWIAANNHSLGYFGSVSALVVCNNCKREVIVNQDWTEPELNRNYAEWEDYYGTVILPTKVRKSKFYRQKSNWSVLNFRKGCTV